MVRDRIHATACLAIKKERVDTVIFAPPPYIVAFETPGQLAAAAVALVVAYVLARYMLEES